MKVSKRQRCYHGTVDNTLYSQPKGPGFKSAWCRSCALGQGALGPVKLINCCSSRYFENEEEGGGTILYDIFPKMAAACTNSMIR